MISTRDIVGCSGMTKRVSREACVLFGRVGVWKRRSGFVFGLNLGMAAWAWAKKAFMSVLAGASVNIQAIQAYMNPLKVKYFDFEQHFDFIDISHWPL